MTVLTASSINEEGQALLDVAEDTRVTKALIPKTLILGLRNGSLDSEVFQTISMNRRWF